MRILVIRHGESEADLLDVHEGRADFELTERGRRQAAAMACHVKENYDVSAIYCSTLMRARQTAGYLSEAMGIPLIPDERLMEFNNGLIAGLERAVAREKYPPVKDLPLHASVYEQESILEFRFRADYMLSKIISETDSDATVAVITHGGMVNQLYRAFLRLPIDSDIVFATGDTGIHEWRISQGRRVVVKSNMTEHAKDI
ncbi:MAG: histidine phosphatase family protein [Lachnospiraceae bacterium]|nr:histidine phosphatase family protein [Lachnospiraceae bacterium]